MTKVLRLINNEKTWVDPVSTSAGVSDANKIVETDSTGTISESLQGSFAYTDAKVRAVTIAGIALLNVAIGNGDGFNAAFGKTQGQINSISSILATKQDALGYTPINKAGDTGISGSLFFNNGLNIDTVTSGHSISFGGVNAGTVNVGVVAPVINIGTGIPAKVINIGNQSTLLDTINFYGTVNRQNVTNLYVTDKLVTYNAGGAAASGFGAGFEIEENSVITGYFRTTGGRDGWLLKAPSNSYDTSFLFSPTAARSVTFKDESGTVAYLSDVHSSSGVAGLLQYSDGSGGFSSNSGLSYDGSVGDTIKIKLGTTNSTNYLKGWYNGGAQYLFLGANEAQQRQGILINHVQAFDYIDDYGSTMRFQTGRNAGAPIVGLKKGIHDNLEGFSLFDFTNNTHIIGTDTNYNVSIGGNTNTLIPAKLHVLGTTRIGATGVAYYMDLFVASNQGYIQTSSGKHLNLGTEDYPFAVFVNGTDGTVGIGTNGPREKLEVKDGMFYISSNGFAHGITDFAPTDVIGRFFKNSANGGVAMGGYSTGENVATALFGTIGTGSTTQGVIVIQGSEKSGTGKQSVGAANVLLQIRNNSANMISVLGNGNTGFGTNAPDTKLHIVGSLKMVDGNQALNKLIVSDANGVGAWTSLSSIITGATSPWATTNMTYTNMLYVDGSGKIAQTAKMNWDETNGRFSPNANNTFDIGTSALSFATIWSNIFRSPGAVKLQGGSTVSLLLGTTEYARIFSSTGNFAVQGGGTYTDIPTARLAVNSTTQGFLAPRMTTTQRDAISSPAEGLIIYNTTTHKLNVFTTAWEAVTSA